MRRSAGRESDGAGAPGRAGATPRRPGAAAPDAGAVKGGAPRRRIFVQTSAGPVVPCELDRDGTVGALKAQLARALGVRLPPGAELLLHGEVLEPTADLAVLRSGAAVLLRVPSAIPRSVSSPCLSPSALDLRADGPFGTARQRFEVVGCRRSRAAIAGAIAAADAGVDAGVPPTLEAEGLGGSYMFRARDGSRVGIFKPADEEPLGPNNPKGFVGRSVGDEGFTRGIRVGEAALREVAAYLLDRGRFAGVPRTALVQVDDPSLPFHRATREHGQLHPSHVSTKLGSFQEFVRHDYDASEHGTSRLPVAEVHRVGILDIRLFNTDRHSGNLLIRRRTKTPIHAASMRDLTHAADNAPRRGALSSAIRAEEDIQLVPIDHGNCLPETLEAPYFEWLHWPQAALPFSREELDYIASLDARKDVEMLRSELPGLRDACLRLLEVTTLLLQRAAAVGLSLAEIGTLMSRPLVGMSEEQSELERLAAQCIAQARAAAMVDEEDGADEENGESDDDDDNDDDCGSDVGEEGCDTTHASFRASPFVAQAQEIGGLSAAIAAAAVPVPVPVPAGAAGHHDDEHLQFDIDGLTLDDDDEEQGVPAAVYIPPQLAACMDLSPSPSCTPDESTSPISIREWGAESPDLEWSDDGGNAQGKSPIFGRLRASGTLPTPPSPCGAFGAYHRARSQSVNVNQVRRAVLPASIALGGDGLLATAVSAGANRGAPRRQRTKRRSRAKSPKSTSEDLGPVSFADVPCATWHGLLDQFKARLDVTLQAHTRATSRQLVTEGGTRLEKFGTSAPVMERMM